MCWGGPLLLYLQSGGQCRSGVVDFRQQKLCLSLCSSPEQQVTGRIISGREGAVNIVVEQSVVVKNVLSVRSDDVIMIAGDEDR